MKKILHPAVLSRTILPVSSSLEYPLSQRLACPDKVSCSAPE